MRTEVCPLPFGGLKTTPFPFLAELALQLFGIWAFTRSASEFDMLIFDWLNFFVGEGEGELAPALISSALLADLCRAGFPVD
ncbi:MAG: hypothetical protein N4A53_13725 [Pelagimonas sp.]|jgi:hypothetical protein|nr:hypothetical protein [Pelagimonas sp.]